MAFEWDVKGPTLSAPRRLREVVVSLFKQLGLEFNSELITTRLSGNPIKVRSGALRRGWNTATIETNGEVETRNWLIGPAADKAMSHGYAWALEHGCVIRPVNAKNLWIPIFGNLTSTGVARITPTEAIKRGGFIRHGIFFGKPIVGKKGKLSALFVLKDKVTIKPMMGAYNLWVRKTRALDSALALAIQENS